MKRLFGVSFLVAGLFAATLFAAPAASAATTVVEPGESIQAAVNHAHPGDVIVVRAGVYHESVAIKTDHLTLRGAGATAGGTIIEPGPETTRCLHGAGGFCVFGKPAQGGGIDRTTGVTVKGFVFRGFDAFGLVGFGVRDLTVQNNFAVGNGEYGITCFDCAGLTYYYNKATGSGEAGFYIGDSKNADATVIGNDAWDNEFGFFFRDANVGRADSNTAHGNCMGFSLLNTGAPNNVHGWTLVNNDAYQNNKACPSGEGPPFSGVGIGLLGASNNDILHNTVRRNQPSGATAISGGIALLDSSDFGGSKPNGNEIRANVLFRNLEVDINDQSGAHGNEFTKNRCKTSNPDGLCVQP
jgi:hypothetical protein